MPKFILFIVSFLSVLFEISYCQQSEKKNKLKACENVTRARVVQDTENFQNLISTLGEDKQEASNKIMTIFLLNCYNKITLYQADDILKEYKEYSDIPSTNKEFKDLLEVEKWEHLLSNPEDETFQMEMMSLETAMKEISSEDLNSKDDVEKENRKPDEDFYATNENKVDFTLFGFNFTKLDKFTKHIIGIFFIVAIFSAVIYGLFTIRNMNKKEGKKRDKPKRNN